MVSFNSGKISGFIFLFNGNMAFGNDLLMNGRMDRSDAQNKLNINC
jgi:hypothetical protein